MSYDKEYNKRYYQEHKEEFRKRSKEWIKEHPGWRKKYYEEHKEEIYKQQTEYRKKNSKKVSKMVLECRRRKVAKLREQGIKNAWAVVNNGVEPSYIDKRRKKNKESEM